MKFIADDGMIFNTMEECEEYEKVQSKGKEVAMLWHGFITMYNVDGEVVKSKFNWDKQTKDYLENTSEIICDEAWFIKIDCSASDWEKITNYFRNEFGTYLPHYEKDIFRYTLTEEWISFHEDYAAFKEKWDGVRF